MRQLLTSLAVYAIAAVSALGQVEPDRLYYGINRAMPFTVTQPEAEGALELALFDSTGRQAVARAAVEPGAVDLFELFPVLWNRSQPELLYLQTLADGEAVGPPVVLEALRPPVPHSINPRTTRVEWGSEKRRPYTGIRAYVAKFVVFETTQGDITIRFRPEHAPHTSRHIIELVEGGFYTDIVVHRILPRNANGDPFVIQFGDPQGYGLGGPGFQIDLEPSAMTHAFGVVSMARSSDSADSNGSQVFICLSRAATSHLDGSYTSFAEVVDGLDAVLAIESAELTDAARGVPADPKPTVISARTVPAPPINEWPSRIKRPNPNQRPASGGQNQER